MTCGTCGAALGGQLTKFCSRHCYTEAQKGCDPFTAESRQRSSWNRGLRTGTSPRNTQVDLTCVQCGAMFKVKAYRSATARFCSRSCHYTHNDHGISSENEKVRKSAAYREWREAVFSRDNWTCQGCGVRGGELHADHIEPFALNPELRLEVDNGRTLCVPCHKATPTYGRAAVYRGTSLGGVTA